ncbi:T-cell receptor gamma chain V region V108B [Myotis brandtii]|nr:T-cell receptor gamma chain V region V108B [Myotis brandtii]
MSFIHGNLFLFAVGLGQFKLEQPVISISRARGESAQIPCKVSSGTFSSDYIHWYRQKPDQSMEHLIYVISTNVVGGKNNKLEASKEFYTSTSTLRIHFLEKKDEAVYFCACWTGIHPIRFARITCTRTIFSLCPPTSFSIWATTEAAQLGTSLSLPPHGLESYTMST